MARKFNRSTKRSPKSDPQQHIVYRMESEAIGGRQYLTLTKPKIISLIKTLARNYHVPAPAVRFNDMTRWAAEWAPPGIITFGKKTTSKDLLTALHEYAHHLHYVIDPYDTHQPHGKEFMCLYMSIIDTTRLIPINAMAVICDSYKIKYIKPKDLDGVDELKELIK